MKTKMMIALLTLLMGMQVNVIAQDSAKQPKPRVATKFNQKPQRPQQVKKIDPAKLTEMKVKSMSRTLMLTDEQATKFQTLYTSYLKDMHNVYAPKTETKKADAKSEKKEITDADIDKHFKEIFQKRSNMVSLQENYYSKFRKFLSAKQVARIFNPLNKGKDAKHQEKARKQLRPMPCQGVQFQRPQWQHGQFQHPQWKGAKQQPQLPQRNK